MSFILGLNWEQVWLGIPIGAILGIVILARHNLYEAAVECLRLLTVFAIDWLIEPLRRFFWTFWQYFEHYIMRTVLYQPLVKIKLLAGVDFGTFCTVIYAAVHICMALILFRHIPSLVHIFWANGCVRRSWVLASVWAFSALCLFVPRTLFARNYTQSAYIVLLLCAVSALLGIYIHFTYPDTNDFAWTNNYRRLSEESVCEAFDAPKRRRTERKVFI